MQKPYENIILKKPKGVTNQFLLKLSAKQVIIILVLQIILKNEKDAQD